MAILDFLKKKKKLKLKKRKKKIKPKEKPVEKPVDVKPQQEKAGALKKKKKKIGEQDYRILRAPHITEKSTDLARKNQYTFLVWQKTNKVEVKKTIEDIYNVEVTDVKIINIPPKRRRLGRTSGWKKGYKKAIVKVKEGQKIEVFPK